MEKPTMEEPKANQMDQIDAPAETTGSILADQDEKSPNLKQANNKPNGLGKLTATSSTVNKSIPLILKRKDARGGYEKLECSEINENKNENIDENKKRKAVETKELVQRSSSRKKIKKSFGLDFVDLGVTQYSNKSHVPKGTKKYRYCTVCLKKDSETEIHHCKICRVRAHEQCFINNLGVSREGYKNKVIICSQCRSCEMCDEKAGQLFFCSRCNSVFHRLCDSNLTLILNPVLGEWQCSFCDTLDSLVGDSLTEEQRKKEIQRRKLLVMRKRLRKSDYVLEDGLCSIQQVVKQAVKMRKKDAEQSSQDAKVEIDLADDELDASKHILSETEPDFWCDNKQSIDFAKLEDYLRKQRKNHNILSKHIKEDKKYFALAKMFIDQLKDEKFNCTKENFLKLINSETFKRSFFELNSLNGLTKSSIFIDALIARFEKYFQNEYWKTEEEPKISQPDYFDSQANGGGGDLITSESNGNSSKQSDEDLEVLQVEEAAALENRPSDEQHFEQKLPEDDQPESIEQSVVSSEQTEKEEPDALEAGANEIVIVEDEPSNPEQSNPIENSGEQQNVSKEADSSVDDLDTNLVNELICEEPGLGDFDEAQAPTEFGVERIKEETKPVDFKELPDEKNLNEENFQDKTNSESNNATDQPLVVDENLSKADLSEDNLIGCTGEKSNEADKAANAEPVTDRRPDLIDKETVQESANRQSTNEPTNDEASSEAANQEGGQSEESGREDQRASGSSGEQAASDTPADRSIDTGKKSPDEVEPSKSPVAERTVASQNSTADASRSIEQRTLDEQAANKTADQQLSSKVNKAKNKVAKVISKQNAKGERKMKIRPSNNLADRLFKRACKYNLNLLEPKYWTAEDVSIYLKQIGFESEAQCFKEKSVDGKSLLKLSRQDVLNNFGIKLGKAVKIAAYVYDLQTRNKCNVLFD